jgi:hypothetical protein
VRASDDTREHTVRVLRGGLLDGRLGVDTFVARVDRAFRAKDRRELGPLTSDLPRPGGWLRRIARVFGEGDTPPPALTPPGGAKSSFLIGRSPQSDFLVTEPTVSAQHAELRRRDDGSWEIEDLDSRNGTRVNGWLAHESRLHPGDVLAFGAVEFTFAPDD